MDKIINLDRSIVPACDVSDIKQFERIVSETASVKGIGAYKLGFQLALKYGLPRLVKAARAFTEKPLIYDHQKAATDIPDVAQKFAAVCKQSGIDAVIFFPQAGPETEKAFILASQKAGLGVIVGGEMTHPAFLQSDNGFIANEAPKRMYEIAVQLGVTDFVVPGNKPEKIVFYRQFLESRGVSPILYSPGLVTQGGELTESAKAAGKNWHAIIGRALYEAPNIKKAAKEYCKKIE